MAVRAATRGSRRLRATGYGSPLLARASACGHALRYRDGDLTLDEAREETAKATRRFARRQESWFRRDPRITWLEPGEGLLPQALSALAQLRPSSG